MTFNLNRALKAANSRITEAEREEMEAFQTEMRTNLGSMLDPNSKESRLSRAKVQEKAILEQIEFLKWKPNNELKRNRLNQLLNRLSELLAEQGKYELAAKTAIEPERRDYYKSLVKAVAAPNESCGCADERIIGGKIETVVPSEMVLAEVVADGEMKHLTYCRSCGLLNIK